MKLRKIMTGIVASALAVSSLAVATSAQGIMKPAANPAPGLDSATGSWLVQVFNVGSEEENKPATEYDIDYKAVTGARFTFTVPETDGDGVEGNREFWDGSTGGAVVLSINGGDIEKGTDLYNTYNWPSKSYWGVTDEALELATDPNKQEDSTDKKDLSTEKIDDYTYQLTANGFANPLANGDASEIGCMQVALQEWGGSIAVIEVTKCEILDESGNVLIAFDGNGNVIANETPADDNNQPADDNNQPADDNNQPADDNNNQPADDNNQPADNKPVNGDSSKGNAGTGVESVAVVAGVAVLATGAIIVAKKRK